MSSLAPVSDYHPLARESACDTNPAPSSTSISAKTVTTAPIPMPHDDSALDEGPHEATAEDQGGPRVVAQSTTSHTDPAETRSTLQRVLGMSSNSTFTSADTGQQSMSGSNHVPMTIRLAVILPAKAWPRIHIHRRHEAPQTLSCQGLQMQIRRRTQRRKQMVGRCWPRATKDSFMPSRHCWHTSAPPFI